MTEPAFKTGFVYTKDLEAQARNVEDWVAAEGRRVKRANIGWKAASGLLVALLGGSTFALAYTVPNIRLLPVFFNERPDGVIEHKVSIDNLSTEMKDVDIKAALWQYVQHREHYSWSGKWDDFYRTNAMSTNAVKKAYAEWFNGPTGYMAVYTDRAEIKIQRTETITDNFTRPVGSVPGHFTVHFARQVQQGPDPAGWGPIETWAASLEYGMNAPQSWFKLQDIEDFNPARIVIVGYPGSEQIGASKGLGQ